MKQDEEPQGERNEERERERERDGRGVVRVVVLLLLVLQTTSSCTLISYSKAVLKEKYNPLEAVMVTEILKLLAAGTLSVVLHKNDDKKNHFHLMGNISRVLLLIGKNLNLVVLVVIWSYTNTMSFRAVSLVGAPVYSVVMQSKIFFTAGFGVLFLSRRYSFTKWRALLLLVIGCTLVSSPILLPKEVIHPCETAEEVIVLPEALHNSTSHVHDVLGNATHSVQRLTKRMLRGTQHSTSSRYLFLSHYQIPISRLLDAAQSSDNSPHEVTPLDALFGLAITLSIAVCSGFTSVYFEKILKTGQAGGKCVSSSPTAIWDRNFQLAFYSIIFTASISIYQYVSMDNHETEDNKKPVLFAGWSWVTFLICIINSLGGFLVAATLKYADSIMKCFASAVSIIITTIIGYFFLGSEINLFSALGMLTTILSVVNYTLVETEQ